MAEIELDPRWDWVQLNTCGDPNPIYVKAGCRHLEVIPVENVAGEVVAQLCLTCDTQFQPPR